ncbi:MAG: ABC transporter ATP-binding protein [Synechococcales bacterium]|nr:ABC transporter ATP-binding protein [Synechococcales bacterium]
MVNASTRLLLNYAFRYPKWIVLTIVLGFSGAFFNGISTAMIVPIILSFLGQGNALQGLPPIATKFLEGLNAGQGGGTAIAVFGGVVLAIGLKNAASYANSLTTSHLSRLLTNGMRQEALQLLLEVDLDFFLKSKVGDLVNRLGTEIAQTASALKALVSICTHSITILVFLGFLLGISWQLTLISTGLLALVALSNQWFVRRAKQFGFALAENSKAYSIRLLEILSGIRLIKATSNEQTEFEKIQHLIAQRERAEFQSQANFAIVAPVNEMAGILVVLLIVVLGKMLFAYQMALASTVLLSYLLLLFRLLPVVSQLNSARNALANATPSLQVVAELLRRDNKPIMPQPNRWQYEGLQQGIRFNTVSFAYPGQNNSVLQDINLFLPKGQTLALVGSSGAGKSTMADLLTRFYDPIAGQVMIDDRDLRDFELRSLHRKMGIVSQDTFLFNDTIFNNIAYACGEVTQEAVLQAAKRANAYEFIQKLPQGFETMIGDRGVLLSGGQRQRLAIARALLRNPDILILDEATSALDTVSERLVQQAIDDLSRDRTVLVIAHRLSTIQNADQIAVFDKGQVVEVGSHEELLQRQGLFAQLYAMQFGAESSQPQLEVIGNV